MAFVRVCDLHDLDQWWVVVDATRTFEFDGRRYEIDLCEEHNAALDQALQPYLEHGRRTERRRAHATSRRS